MSVIIYIYIDRSFEGTKSKDRSTGTWNRIRASTFNFPIQSLHETAVAAHAVGRSLWISNFEIDQVGIKNAKCETNRHFVQTCSNCLKEPGGLFSCSLILTCFDVCNRNQPIAQSKQVCIQHAIYETLKQFQGYLGIKSSLKKCFKKCGQKLACASHNHVLGWEIRKNINTAWKWTSNRKKWYWSVGKRNIICEPNHL